MTSYTIKHIADALGAEAQGDLSLQIIAVNEPQSASSSELALAMDPSYAEALLKGNAKAAIVWDGADWEALGLKAVIFAPRSRYILSGVSYLFEKKAQINSGIHATCIIDPTAKIGKNPSFGPFVVIGADVTIGDNACIASHSSIAENSVIGKNAFIYQGVRIGARVEIGDDFICQPNAVIGSDGFSFVTPKPGAIEEARSTRTIIKGTQGEGFARINSMGSVVIGNTVEIGSNTAIDRGTISNTHIGNGTKIDNLVQIGHNVIIGENCLLCGQVGIAGSSKVGDRVILGGKCAVADHINIGSDVIAAGKSGISSNVPPKRVIMGSPAVKMATSIESYKAVRRLPRLVAKVAALEKIVFKNKGKG
jgi:UDP-3-O-[3-hydroxymyristoyl] glucosamine N-acyltransferase